jgi:phosphotransferase system  glucose/maltose/N-acetylglucosamine-specific IIC component
MKTILFGAATFLSYLGGVVSAIWAIIEFILYLVKDRVFNWWSVWAILICIGVGVISFLFTVIFSVKENRTPKNLIKRKSAFMERLEETQKKRLENK